MRVTCQNIGLYGKQVVTLECSKTAGSFPSTSISTGDIVGIFVNGKSITENVLSGIVIVLKQSTVSVAFDDLSDTINLSAFDGSLQLVKLCNDVTYQRMRRSLEAMKSSVRSHCLIPLLFGESPLAELDPQFCFNLQELSSKAKRDSSYPFFNKTLNWSQQKAVLFALSRKDIAIIHGPPGTGKTTTVIEIILQSIKLGHKILACAPSNLAVDNLVEKLGMTKAKIVRIGHPARIVETVQKYSLDALLSASDSADIIKEVRKDLQIALEHCMKSRTSSERQKWRNDVKSFKRELLKREKKAVKEVLGNAEVVLSTINGASPDGSLKYLPEDFFDVVVIDECAQAIEPSCWIAVLRAPKCILAGDDKQLPPTILSIDASKGGLSLSMMERLCKLYGKAITATLVTQYRMHQSIMSWPSSFLYDDLLEADPSVATHLLSDLSGVIETSLTSVPLMFIDNVGCNMTELDTADEESKGNEGEADLVLHYLKRLSMAGVPLCCVAVITPYNLQVDLIRQRLPIQGVEYESVEVHSVDGFQGREKEAVIISFTRSNKKGQYGFLQEIRRTNVAMTRARRHLAMIGDSFTLSHEPFINGMISYCHEYGEVHSAHDYINDADFEERSFYSPKVSFNISMQQKKAVKPKKQYSSRPASTANVHPDSKSRDVPHIQDNFIVSESVEIAEECSYRYREKLKEFMDSEQVILKFPPSLTGTERKCVHQICDEIGLLHKSRGQGMERYIEVTKMSTKVEKDITIEKMECKLLVTEVSCPICGKAIIEDNMELHLLHCTKAKFSVPKKCDDVKCSDLNSTRVKKAKPVKAKPVKSERECEDSDSMKMLTEMSLIGSFCGLKRCKKKVNVLGLQCYFCQGRFCMEHNIPEVHGCAEAAKKHAKQVLKHNPASSSSGTRRAQLQKKLDSKLEELSSGRQSKAKGK